MYVFAPGDGCTGPTHLVRPGDELIFNSTYNASDWATENSVKTEYFSEETLKQVCWVRKMYHEWRSYRNSQGLAFIACDLEHKATITAESLKFALCRFITEVKKIDGHEFPGKMLNHLVVCIQFHLECLRFAFKIINDPAFKDLKFTLDNTMKARVSQGIGLLVKQAQVITATNEDLLWSLGLLGTSHPE